MTHLPDIEIEDEVLARARAGAGEAQAAVYQAFSPATYALIRRLIPRKAVADDLLQDTFVEVLRSLARFRGEAPVGAWIRRIAVSKCLMYLRSPWHRSLLWLDAQAGDEQLAGNAEHRTCHVDLDPGNGVDLERALERLTATSRAVVWLYDVEGYTHEEIAAVFGKTISFSKSQLMRAHSRLRQLLDPEREGATCTPVSSNS